MLTKSPGTVLKELPLGGWVNHAAGTVGLMAMQTFGEVSAFGMIRDGTDPRGEAFYPVHYLRYYLKGWYTQGDTPDIQVGHGSLSPNQCSQNCDVHDRLTYMIS